MDDILYCHLLLHLLNTRQEIMMKQSVEIPCQASESNYSSSGENTFSKLILLGKMK